MKIHLPVPLRKALLSALAIFTTVPATTDAAVMHSGVSMLTYSDFGQNMGRYAVGDTNALLKYIRQRENGVVVTYVYPEVNAPYILPHGMIDYSSQNDGGYGVSIGYNFYATVRHNGVHNNTYTGNYIGDDSAIHYQTIEYRNSNIFLLTPANDYKIGRQSKLITDVTGSTIYNSDTRDWQDVADRQLVGQSLYRAGSGTMQISSLTGEFSSLSGGGYIIGGISVITSTGTPTASQGSFTTKTNMGDTSLNAITDLSPIPFFAQPGDSGSPSWVWNDRTGRFEYFAAAQGIVPNVTFYESAPKWTLETIDSFSVNVNLGATEGEGAHGVVSHVRIGAVDTAGDTITDSSGVSTTTWKGKVYDGGHNELAEYIGMHSGVNTWADLSGIKDNEKWYNYGNGSNIGTFLLPSYADLFFTNDLVFTAGAETTDIVAEADVDLGIGYVRLCKGEGMERARFDIGGGHMVNSAGYVVDSGVDAYITLTNPDNYMYEWRAIVEEGATLHIEGTGDTNALLNVGRSGTTYLNRTEGYAAYNVLANNGARVVIRDLNQIKRDFTFGFRGGVLDMNGQSMTWNNGNGADAAGFTIHALDEQAKITNAKAGTTTTLTWTQGGGREWLGSFVDEAGGGALKFIYDGGEGSMLTLRSIHTDLHNVNGDDRSGITVASGTLKLEGTNVVHGKGSIDGRSGARYSSNRDWHYVDMSTSVEIRSGATFELGSHARLAGNVTINEGGTFIMREGVQRPLEYVEGGQTLEDTSLYSDYYGLKGDIVNNGQLRIEYSPTETVTSVNLYGNAISGTGSLVIDTGAAGARIELSGANTLAGTRTVEGGGVVLKNEEAFGTGDTATGATAWKIAERGWLGVENVDQGSLLPHIHTDSNGALALTQDTADSLGMSGHANLFIGAESGRTVQYGGPGTSEELAAWHPTDVEGHNQWLFGGGGGELVVNWKLTGDNDIVLGNPYMSGTVTLANIENDFTGTILFAEGGNVVLNYTNPRALGGARVVLTYGKALSGGSDVPSMLGGDTITATADGILLVDASTASPIDLTGHRSLQLGANAEGVGFAGTITVANNAAYRLGGPGELILENALAARGTNDLVVDAQGFSGGIVALKSASGITGNVTVMGHDAAREAATGITGGDIILALVADDTLAHAASVTVKDGGTLLVGGGSAQHFNALDIQNGGGVEMGLVTTLYAGTLDMATGTSLYGVVPTGTAVQTGGGSIAGTVEVASMVKTGSGTLTLAEGHSLRVDSLDVRGGSVALGADSAISGTITLHSGTNAIAFNNHYLGSTIDVAAGETASFSGQTLKLRGAHNHLASGGTLDLTGTPLVELQVPGANSGPYYGGTVKVGDTTLYSDSGADNMRYSFAHLEVRGNAKLEQRYWNTLWNIEHLTGEGSLTWKVGTTHSINTTLALTGEGDFDGTLTVCRTANASEARKLQTILEVSHDNALRNATLQLKGSGWMGYVGLAVNTDEARMRGLVSDANGSAWSFVYAGAALTTPTGNAPASTRNAILNLTGDGEYTYKGGVCGSADNALSLVKSGSGTQTFEDGNSGAPLMGNAVFRDVTVQAGTLNLNHSSTTVHGDYAIAQGATLNVAGGITLTENHSLAALNTADNSGSATLGSALTLAGGTLTFSGEGLQSLAENTYLLSLASIAKADAVTSLTVNFVDVGHLRDGDTYLLASGDFGALSLDYTATGVDFLDATFQATSSGLSVTLGAKDGAFIWNGTDAAHSWTDSVFSTVAYSTPAEQDFFFTDTAANKTVSVDAAGLQAKSIEISGKGYTFEGGALSDAGALTLRENATAAFNSAVSLNGDLALATGATAEFAGLTMTSGTAALEERSRLVVAQNGNATLNIAASSTGTLDVEIGATANLGEVNGTAQYRLDGSGTVNLTVQGGTFTLASTGNTFEGTLHVTIGDNNFVAGANGAIFADGSRPGIVLSGGVVGKGFALDTFYSGIDNALHIGSLSGDSGNVEIRSTDTGNPAGVKYRYISVHQDGESSFAGKFVGGNDSSVGLIMNGEGEVGGGTLTLQGNSQSTAKLIINAGTIAMAGGSGHWDGDVEVNGGGQLHLQRNGSLNAGKVLSIVGNGVAEFTDAAGNLHEARGGALKLDHNINLAHAVTVLNPGASVMTEAGVTATISQAVKGTGTLTKIGGGTLKLSGTSTGTGDLCVEEGTVILVNGSTWHDDIVVENGANLTTEGSGDFNVEGNITRNYTGGTHSRAVSALDSSTASAINIGDGTTLNLMGGEFSDLVIGGAQLNSTGNNKGASIGGVSMVNVDGATVTGDIHGGSQLATYAGQRNITTDATVVNLYSGTVHNVYGGHRVNGGGTVSIDGTVSVGSTLVNLDGATVTGTIYGGSYVERNVAANTIEQGAVVVDLNAGSLAGNVYAGGKQEKDSHLQTETTEVKISNAVSFTGSNQIISGGYETSKTNSSITGARTLTLTSADAYDNLDGLAFKEFEVINSAATSATLANFANTGSLTKEGAGCVTLSQTQTLSAAGIQAGTLAFSGGVAFTGDVAVAENATLSLGGAISLASAIQSAGTVDFSGATFTIDQSAFVDNRYDLVTGTGTTTGILTLDNFSGIGGNVRLLGMGGGNVYLLIGEAGTLVWNGTAAEGGDAWGGVNWRNDDGVAAFASGSEVRFTDVAQNRSVSVTSGGVEVTDMGITAPDYEFHGGAVTVAGDFTMAENASAVFNNTLSVAGSVELNAGSTLALNRDASLTVAANTTNTGTLEVGRDATLNLGNVSGTASYRLAGEGTVRMNITGGDYIFASADNTLSGALEINLGGGHFIAGSAAAGNVNFSGNPDITLTGGSGSSQFIINSNYHGTDHVLNIGSLSSESTTVDIHAANGANPDNEDHRYLSVHQDGDTTFAGKFLNAGRKNANGTDGLRGAGLIMNGMGTLTLTGNNNSMADLIVSSGTVALSGSGYWKGDVTVENGGQLHLQKNGALNSAQSLSIAGAGVANQHTRSASVVREGALVLDDGVTLAHDVTIDDVSGAAIMTDAGATGTISGAVTGGGLTKVGDGKLALTGTVDTSGISVDAGTLSLRNAVTLNSPIESSATVDFNGASLSLNLADVAGNRYDIVRGSGTTTGTLTLDNISFVGETPAALRLFGMGTGNVSLMSGAIDLIWNGTAEEGGNTWVADGPHWSFDNNGAPVETTFSTGDRVSFTADTGNKSVAVGAGGVDVGAMNVTGGSYIFTGGAISSTGDLTLGGNASATFNNASLTVGGAISLDSGSTLRFGYDATAGNAIAVGENGATLSAAPNQTVTLTGTVTGGALVVDGGGAVAVGGGGSFGNSSVTVNSGTQLDLGSGDAIGADTTLTVGGVLKLENGVTLAHPLNLAVPGGGTVLTDAGATGTISGTITGSPLIKTGSGTLILAGTQNSLQEVNLNGGTLVFDTDTTVSSHTFADNTTAKVGTGHTLTLTGVTRDNIATLFAHAAADADHDGTVSLSLTKVDNQKLQGTHNISANYRFTGASGIEFNNWNSASAYDATLNVKESGSITVDNRNLAITSYVNMNIQGGEVTAPNVVIGAGEGNNNCAHLTLESGSLSTHSISLNCRSNNAATHSTNFVMSGGTLDLSGGTEDIFLIYSAYLGTREISLTGGTVKVDAARNVGVDLTMGGVEIISAGEGSGITFAAGKTVTWDSLITNNGGDLAFNGTIALAEGALDGIAPAYIDALDPTGGSGYKVGKLLVQSTNGGAVSLGGAAALTVGGAAATEQLTVINGNLYTGGGTLYYVNTGTDLQYGANTNSAASTDTTGIVLNGGNMHMLQSLTTQVKEGSGVDMQANATVHIGADATLDMANVTKNGHTLTIDGSGVFVNSPGAAMQAAMTNTWTGTVEISGTLNAIIFGNYGRGSSSTVRCAGVTGWIQVGNRTINENIELVPVAEGSALNITGTSGGEYAFNGSVSGAGDFALDTGTSSDNITFAGDVSNWTGALTHHNNSGATVLKFTKAGDATLGMSSVTHTGNGTLEVQVSGNGAKTIAGKLTNTTLTMNGGGTMGFTRQLAMENGKLVINSGTVTLDQNDGKTAQLKNTDVEVHGGGKLTIAHDSMGWKDNATDTTSLKSVLLQGSGETNRAVLSNADTTGNNIFSATLNMAGHALVEGVEGAHNMKACVGMAINATGTDNEISSGFNIAKSITVTVGDATHPGSELKVSGQLNNNNTITKAGDGLLELTGTAPTYGTWNLNAGTLKVTQSGNMTLNTGAARVGTLEVAQGATINLGETNGGAYYSLNGAGNVSLKSNGGMYILASTGNTLSGTLTVEIGNNHFLLGADANTEVNFAENARPNLVLVNNNATNSHGFILNKNYAGIDNAFEIGSLASDSVNAQIRADWGNNSKDPEVPYRYVSVHQDGETTYAGTFRKVNGNDDSANRSVGLIMNGAGAIGGGTLNLTGNSESVADLIINAGTVAIGGENGHWSGDATVNTGGQLYLQRNSALDSDKALTLAGVGVAAYTDADGVEHAARSGALKLANELSVANAVTIASGASVYVEEDAAATLSGTIAQAADATAATLAKVGGGTLNLTGGVDVPGIDVQAGTLSLGGGTVTLHGAITSAGTVDFNGSAFAISAADFTGNRFDVVTGTGTTTGTLVLSDFTVDGDTDPLRLAGMGTSNVYIYAGNTELTWNGTNATGGNAWGNENWLMGGTSTSFVAGDTVNFTADAENKAVAVTAGGVSVGDINITGNGYSFTGGSITTTGDITVADGVSVSQNGGIKVGGNLDVGENATFTIAAGNVLDDSTLTKTGAGTLRLNSKLTAGAFDIQEGSLVLNHFNFEDLSSINLQEDTKLVLNDQYTSIGAASGDPVTQIAMADGAAIEMKNGAANTRVNAAITVDATDHAAVIRGVENGSGNLYVAGTIAGDGTLTLASMSGDGVKNTNSWAVNSAVSDGTDATLALDITDVTISIGGDADNTYSGGTNISNSSVTVNKATAFGAGAVEMSSSTLTLGSDLSVVSISGAAGNSITGGGNTLSLTAASGTATYAGAISGAALEKSGAGTQVISGAASLNSLSVTAGSLTLSGGATLSGTATVTGGTLTLGGNVTLASAIANAGTVAFDNASFSLTADAFTDSRYDIVTGDGTTSGAINLSVADSESPVRVVGMGSGSVYAYLGNGELTWNGTNAEGGTAWGNANWLMESATASFATGDTVHFTTAARNKEVAVEAAGVTAATMDITATGYSFSGGAITTTSLTLGEGVTATFGSALTVANAITLNNSTLKFATDGAYTVGMNMTGAGKVQVSGSGAKTIGGKLTNVTLTMDGSDTLGFTQQLAMDGGKLIVNSGTVTVDNHNGGTSQLKNTAIEVYGGGTLVIKHDAMGWDDGSCVSSILLQGAGETGLAVLDNNDTDTSNGNRGTTSRVALNMAGHALVKDTGTHGIRVWSDMTITATGGDNTISSALVVDKPLSITVGDADHTGSALLVSGIMSNSSDCPNQAVTVSGNGTLSLTADNTANGSLTINSGTVEIGAAGGTTGKWSGDVTVASGAQLTLNKDDAMASGKSLTLAGTGIDAGGALVFADGVTLGNAVSVASGGASVMAGAGVTGALSGTLSGNGSLAKVGTGTLQLNRADTGVGISVDEGTLQLMQNTTVSNGKSFAVNANATLDGSGKDLLVNSASGAVTFEGDVTIHEITTKGSSLTISGGTTTVEDRLRLEAGTTTITNASVSAKRLQMVDERTGDSCVTIGVGAKVVISGSDDVDSLLLAGWSHGADQSQGTLTVENGGKFTATDNVVQVSYWNDSTGHLNIDGGIVNVKGISFHHDESDANKGQIDNSRGTLTLSNGGVLTIGSAGITGVQEGGDSAVSVSLGEGAIKASADWTMGRYVATASGVANDKGLLDVSLTDAATGTTFDTNGDSSENGHTITIDNNLVGEGALVKEGKGTLTLNGANTYGGTTTVKAGDLVLGATGSLSTSETDIKNGATLQSGHATLLANSEADGTVTTAKIEGDTISGLAAGEGPARGEMSNLKVLYDNAKLTVKDMVISADSYIGKQPVSLSGDTMARVGDSTELAADNSTLKLEQGAGKNVSSITSHALTSAEKADAVPDLTWAVGTDLSLVTCTGFNVDVLSGNLTVDLSAILQDMPVVSHFAVVFQGVSGMATGTTIQACLTSYTTTPAVSYGSAGVDDGGDLIAYFVVPEPTTATLSLLALATLALRRRRRGGAQ